MLGRRMRSLILAVAIAGLTALIPSLVLAMASGSFVGPLHTVSTVASTVPGNATSTPTAPPSSRGRWAGWWRGTC